jgi:hypothetical protein
MGDWQNFDNTPRIQAVQRILAEIEANDASYLSGEIDRDKWMEVAKTADEKLAVAGLRLAVRPWQTTR